MKLYQIKNAEGVYEHKDISIEGDGHVVWAGTQADAGRARREFEAQYKELPSAKRPRITVEEVDVPTSKAELLAWLNERGVK